MAAKGRFKRGQTVYVRYHHSQLLRGLMADPDGPLVFVSMQPAANKFGRQQCRLRLPAGTPFLDGSETVDVASNLVVVTPKAEQQAEENERIAERRSAGARG